MPLNDEKPENETEIYNNVRSGPVGPDPTNHRNDLLNNLNSTDNLT